MAVLWDRLRVSPRSDGGDPCGARGKVSDMPRGRPLCEDEADVSLAVSRLPCSLGVYFIRRLIVYGV